MAIKTTKIAKLELKFETTMELTPPQKSNRIALKTFFFSSLTVRFDSAFLVWDSSYVGTEKSKF